MQTVRTEQQIVERQAEQRLDVLAAPVVAHMRIIGGYGHRGFPDRLARPAARASRDDLLNLKAKYSMTAHRQKRASRGSVPPATVSCQPKYRPHG